MDMDLDMGMDNVVCAEFLAMALCVMDGEDCSIDVTVVIAHIQACPPCTREYDVQRQVKSLVSRSAGCTVAPESLRVNVVASIQRVSATIVRPDVTAEGEQP